MPRGMSIRVRDVARGVSVYQELVSCRVQEINSTSTYRETGESSNRLRSVWRTSAIRRASSDNGTDCRTFQFSRSQVEQGQPPGGCPFLFPLQGYLSRRSWPP